MRKIKANRRNWQLVALAVLATLFSSSCGGGASSQGKTATSSVAGLTFNTNTLDFGSIAVGSSKKASITVTNSAISTGGSVTVSKLIVTGASFSLVTPTSEFSVDPGQTVSITVAFAPKAAGTATGDLTVGVAGAAGESNISLTGGTLTGSQLGVSPGTLNFGTVNVGTTKTLTGTLSAAASDITVNSASWNGQGYAISGITFPLTVPAGKNVSYTVTFTPAASGSVSGGVIFVSNASNSPSTQTFKGSGGVVAQASVHSVDLSWDPSTSAVVGYNLYRGTKSGGPYSRINGGIQPGPTFTDSSVNSGSTYYYVATSVDENSTESAFSDQVAAVVPNP